MKLGFCSEITIQPI